MKISDLKSLFLEIKKKTVCFVAKLPLPAAWLKVPENRTTAIYLKTGDKTNKQTNKQSNNKKS